MALVAVIGIVAWRFVPTTEGNTIPVRVFAETGPEATEPRRSSSSILDASGYVVARRQATVSAQVTGQLAAVLIEEGQAVQVGQIIARLDDSNAAAVLAQARARLAEAQAQSDAAVTALANAKPIFERNRALHTENVISSQDYEVARASYDAAEAQVAVSLQTVAVARADVALALRNKEYTVVRAPFSGIVTVKAAQAGEIISPVSAGGGFTRTGIGTIVDMDSLEVEVDVSENFIQRVHPGQSAIITLSAYPDWTIPAEVIAIVSTADRAKATVKVRVGFKEKDSRVLPEMGARVSFLTGP